MTSDPVVPEEVREAGITAITDGLRSAKLLPPTDDPIGSLTDEVLFAVISEMERIGWVPPWMEEVDLHSDDRIRVYGQTTDDDNGFLEDYEPESCNWFFRLTPKKESTNGS